LHKSKFEACVSGCLPPQQMADLYEGVQAFEDVADVRRFTACMETAQAAPVRRAG
jgi:hypothetical protein